jgi:putative FmdB family regulatory protein
MPIYEYRCAKCGEFEVTQRITEDPLQHCPTCRRKVQKLISNTSFQLKGTGWYITDYARKGTSPENGKSEKASAVDAEGNGKASTSSDAGDKSSGEKKPAKPSASDSSSSKV